LRVNSSGGLVVKNREQEFNFSKEGYNVKSQKKLDDKNLCCYYDLLFEKKDIPAKNRVILRLAGNKIKDIIRDKDTVSLLPVGIHLSIPEPLFRKCLWFPEDELNIIIGNIDKDIITAVEAGPLLINDGKISIDMEIEGWKTDNSIRTQAARLDYLDMRGPKIAIGIDKIGNLSVLTVNGRIRESVVATHSDMAEIMKEQEIVYSMGFDPGGSSTLVVYGKTLNISPYNHEYEKDVYSLPPEPRAVANAILGWME